MHYSNLKYTKNFFNIEDKLDKIIKIMDEYDFYDLLISVYCINICVNNRSVLESQMKLNLGLKLCKRTGTKKINFYKDFKEFFKRIKPYIDNNIFTDPILEDFDDIKFRFESELYNVIIGTGYNSSYAQLFFLEPMAILTKSNDKIKKVLIYNSNNIEYFKDVNISNEKGKIRVEIPSNKLYKRVKKYFQELDFNLTKEINEIVKNTNHYIEKEHFILYECNYYPLYNTSILIDIFDKMYSKLSIYEQNLIADNGIYNLLSSLCIIDQGEDPYLYFPLKLHCKIKNYDSNSYTFLGITSKKSCIIAINKSKFNNDEELQKEMDLITELLNQNKLEFIEMRKRSPKGFRGITLTNKCELKFILYNNYLNIEEPNMILTEERKKNILECSALDLIYILAFSDGLDEIESFIDYNEQDEYDQMIGFGGDSSRFFTWKSMSHMIAKGAIKFGMISTDINITDGYVLDYFKDKLKNFPWKASNNYLFGQPFSWIIEKESNDIYLYRNKIIPSFFGYVRYFNNGQTCFFAQNMLFWDENNIDKMDIITSILDDLLFRKIKTCYNYMEKISTSSGKSLYFIFMPFEYAKKDNMNVDDDKKIVYSEFEEDAFSLNIRYTINYELLYKEINNCSNRKIENKFVKELFEPMVKKYKQEISEFFDYLDSTNEAKKEVEVVQIELDYMYNNSFKKYRVEDYDYLKVKKKIAEVCLNNEISPGEYYGKKATNLIRKMQKELIKKFEDLICNYNQFDLHIKLLEMYANSTHEVYVHQRRYMTISNVTEEVLSEVRSKIVEQREESKANSRTLLYLIETNLYLKRESNNKIDNDELRFILAFSHWLVNLNDTADICFFTENEAHVEVNFEYVVDNINDYNDIDPDIYIKRVYSKNNYSISHDSQDIVYFDKVKRTFDDETGCNLGCLFDICYFLQMKFLDYDYQQLDCNVYRINKRDFTKNLFKIINNKTEEKYSMAQIEKNLDLLTISPEKLKTWKGKEDFFLPFNEREKRNQRFEIKPILCVDDDIIFSPSVIRNVNSLWFEGITNFMLPYEIGIPRTRTSILEWKKRYEDKMVYDIKDIFENNGISFVKVNVELYKIDKSEKYPKDIGDYDVIAIDDIRKNIWIVESKFLNKVGSFYEMFDQQRNFFKDNKYIEKFKRRIEYMNENYKRILKSYGFIDVSGYKVIPYMVFNKVMISRYKKIDFPLISIMELEDEIKEKS